MKKRLGTVLLLALFVISSMMPTSAATAEIWNEARASHYFDAGHIREGRGRNGGFVRCIRDRYYG